MTSSNDYISEAGEEHRRRYGQYFTHPEVARFMVDWVLGSGLKGVFDPAFGLGAFLSATERFDGGVFSGCEIDRVVLDYWFKHSNKSEPNIVLADYFDDWGAKWNNIVCNPPYMRFQRFDGRSLVAARFLDKLGLRLSGYTNVASAFLLKSLSELNDAGRLAYVMPLEFLNTGYGSVVKRRLLHEGRLEALVRLDCEKDVFPDVITSVGILLFSKTASSGRVKFCSVKSLDQLSTCLQNGVVREMNQRDLDPEAKWMPYFSADAAAVTTENFVPMGYYGKFGRGIATGSNSFFVLKASDVRRLGLEDAEVVTCISRSSQLSRPVLDAGVIEKLVEADASVFLFSASRDHSLAADAYIKNGEKLGISNRYLTRNRNPWYKTEVRTPASILLGVFSRGGYKVILNRTNALNLTCYHGFFPNAVGRRHVERIFLYLSSGAGRKIISTSARHYGDSLDKFEPGDLNMSLVPCERILDQISDDEVGNAVCHLVEFGMLPKQLESFFSSVVGANNARSIIIPRPSSLSGTEGCGVVVNLGVAELPLFCQR